MAFDAKPSTWIANWSEDATNITVPIATFTEMTAAEADATTGDIRKVVFAILEHLWGIWYATAAADRPAKMTMDRSISIDDGSGVVTKQYVFVFKTTTSGQEVSAE